MVLLSLSAPVLVLLIVELPENTPASVPAVAVSVDPTRFVFLTMLFVAPLPTPVLVRQISAVAVLVLVLVNVKSREVPVIPGVFEPSIMMKSAPFRLIMQDVLDPVND